MVRLGRRATMTGAAGAAAAAALAWWGRGSSGDGYPHGTVSIATGLPDGVYRRYGAMLQPDIENALPGVSVRLDGSRGSVENLRRVVTGRSDLTIATIDAVALLPAADRARLRAVARLYDDYLQLVVPADSPVASAAGLRGRRVAVGPPGSGVALAADRLLRVAGLDPRRDVHALPYGIDEAPSMLEDGAIDAFFWSGGLPTTAVTALSRRTAVRLVPLGDLAPRLPSVYRSATMPADSYPAVRPLAGPVATVAVPNVMAARADADPRLVERITRTVIDNRDQIGRVVHAAQLVDLRTAIYTAPLPLHEGARRYYRSVKP
nr:TAXI family TRAP transporter solute-binding subunit [Mangrovactinospora gilvigrisea]